MKHLLPILITALLFAKQTIGQDFITPIVFEDAAGNFDTLLVGYDQDGTLGIDTSLGEENIIQIPRDSVFDVRASDEAPKRRGNQTGTFHTKRQIIPNPCNLTGFDAIYGSIISIDIKAQHWPVKMYWNNDFQDDCVDSSWVTTFPIGGWCDVVCSPLIDKWIYAAPQQQIEINKPSYFDDGWCGFVENQDSILYLSLVFYDDKSGCPNTVGIQKTNIGQIKIYPTPANDFISIEMEGLNENSIFYLYSLEGKRMMLENLSPTQTQIDVSGLESGLYIYGIENDQQLIKKGRLVITD